MPKTQPETLIRNQVRDALRFDGWFVFYLMQSMGAYPGVADLCAVKDARVVWLEIKTAAGRLSDGQIKFQLNMERHGGVYRVVRSVSDVTDLLSNIQMSI